MKSSRREAENYLVSNTALSFIILNVWRIYTYLYVFIAFAISCNFLPIENFFDLVLNLCLASSFHFAWEKDIIFWYGKKLID